MITTEPGGRAALVTGGSRGIVRRPASEGASLACLPATSPTARRVLAARSMGNLDVDTRLGAAP